MENLDEKKKVGRPSKRIVDYIVVWEPGADRFAEIVKRKVAEGYKPQGGVVFCGMTPEGVIVFAQAMIKEN